MGHAVALLRAVNLGPHQRVSSADLKALAGRLKLADAKTLLASGNLVFEDDGRSPAALEKALEAASVEWLGLETDYFVRDAKDLAAVVSANPFAKAAKEDPSHLVVFFMKKAAGAAAVKALRGGLVGPERVEAVGRHAYLHYPAGIGTSKLTNKVLEKHLGSAGTGRNWNTVLKLLSLTIPK
ncbi:MAG TPA: DUF1697 domain-containing protein [Polyangiaceae bacterium]|jgi:uncharacterized protein (DUF1697 family)